MIDHIQLLRNIGKFDSVAGGSQLGFSKMTLLYSDNGGGGTILAAIFRARSSGDGTLITERRRLAVRLGADVYQRQNLAKSVTVE